MKSSGSCANVFAMKYRRLGRTNLQVSEIGHGLWGMSGWTGSDDTESRRALRLSLELGCNFFDTAWAYGQGKSDHLLGELIRENPKAGIIAASKIPPMNGKWPARDAYPLRDVFPRHHVVTMAEKIREALGTESIDVLQLHVWTDAWAQDPEWRDTAAELKEKKIVRWFGLSLNRWQPWNGLKAMATGAVDTVQVVYNLFDQSPEDELFPACRAQDVGVIARVPLDEGGLTGTLRRDTTFPPDDWRGNVYFTPAHLAETVERVERLQPLVPQGMPLAELALRFVLHAPEVATQIVGMRKERNVRQNAAISDGVALPAELLDALRAHRWERTNPGE